MTRNYDCEPSAEVDPNAAPIYAWIRACERVLLEVLDALEQADASDAYLAVVSYTAVVYDGQT